MFCMFGDIRQFILVLAANTMNTSAILATMLISKIIIIESGQAQIWFSSYLQN